MSLNANIRNAARPSILLAIVATVCALYFARDVCIPLVLAILLSFVLSPAVTWLQKRHVPRAPAAALVVLFLLLAIGFSGWLFLGQLVSLAEKLPQYQANVHEKLNSFRTSQDGVVDRLNKTLDSYSKEIESIGSTMPATTEALAPGEAAPPATRPVAVAIVKTHTSIFGAIESMATRILGPIMSFGIVLVLALIMLVRKEDVRDRAIRLLGGGQLQIATQALDDAGKRVSRYLFVQLIINVSFGICIAAGCYFIGVPYSLLWGLLAAVLRFVPYFGAPIAAVCPLVMAFAAMPGWTAVILTIVLFTVLELSISNFVEPWLYGSSVRVSPLAIVAAAIFWFWLWGPIGLLLSTPLTVCLVVIGRHVPRLWFLGVILGDEPVLAPEARFYQRLLAADQAEAWELAEKKLQDASLVELYDTMIIPGIVLAEEDRHRDELDEVHEKYIFQSIRELLEDLAERTADALAPMKTLSEAGGDSERSAVSVEPGGATPELATGAAPNRVLPTVLCIPANDEADEMGAIMLAHLLNRSGMKAEVVSAKALAGERLDVVEARGAMLVCISAMPPQAMLHARFICKRMRARYPELTIVVGLWSMQKDVGRVEERLPAALANAVVTTLAAAVERIASLASVQSFQADLNTEVKAGAQQLLVRS